MTKWIALKKYIESLDLQELSRPQASIFSSDTMIFAVFDCTLEDVIPYEVEDGRA